MITQDFSDMVSAEYDVFLKPGISLDKAISVVEAAGLDDEFRVPLLALVRGEFARKKVIDDKTVRITTSSSSSSTSVKPVLKVKPIVAETPRKLIDNVTPMEEMYVLNEGNERLRKALIAIMSLDLEPTEWSGILSKLKILKGDQFFPIRTEVTLNDINHSAAVGEIVNVHSVQFMNSYWSTISGVHKYSGEGLSITAGGETATIIRGVPFDPKSSELLSKWCSTSTKRVTFPVDHHSNAALSGLYSHIYHEPSSSLTSLGRVGVLKSSSRPKDAMRICAELNKYFLREGASSADTFVHHVQEWLHRNPEEAKNLVRDASTAARETLKEFIKTMDDNPVTPLAHPVLKKEIAENERHRNIRNVGAGRLVHHRTMNALARTTFENHELIVLNEYLLSSCPKASVVNDVVVPVNVNFYGKFNHANYMNNMSSRPENVNIVHCPTPVKGDKLMGPHLFVARPLTTIDTTAHPWTGTFSDLDANVKEFVMWGNLVDVVSAATVTPAFLRGWKIGEITKVGSFHIADALIVLVKKDKDDEPFITPSLRYAARLVVALTVRIERLFREQAIAGCSHAGLSTIAGLKYKTSLGKVAKLRSVGSIHKWDVESFTLNVKREMPSPEEKDSDTLDGVVDDAMDGEECEEFEDREDYDVEESVEFALNLEEMMDPTLGHKRRLEREEAERREAREKKREELRVARMALDAAVDKPELKDGPGGGGGLDAAAEKDGDLD